MKRRIARTRTSQRAASPDETRRLIALLQPGLHQTMVHRNTAIVAQLRMIAHSNLGVAE